METYNVCAPPAGAANGGGIGGGGGVWRGVRAGSVALELGVSVTSA